MAVVKQLGRVAFCCCLFVFCSLQNSHAGQDVVRLVVSSDAAPYVIAADALRDVLEDQDVVTQSFTLESVTEQLPRPISGDSRVVWVAVGSRAAEYLHSTLLGAEHLVYCMVAKPELIGIGKQVPNVAGVAVTIPVKDQFALIAQALPEMRTIGMLYRSTSAKSLRSLKEVQEQLPPHWKLQAINIDASGSMAKAIQKLVGQQVDLIWTTADSSVYNRATVKALLLASLRNNIPVFGFSGSFVKAGALLGLEADPRLQGQYAAALVQEIFLEKEHVGQHEKAGVSLAVNMIVADRLGISLPHSVMQQSHVIGSNR